MTTMAPEGWKKSVLGKEIKLLKGSLAKDFYEKPAKGMVPYLLIDSFNGVQSKYVYPGRVNICKEDDPILVMDGSRSGLVLKGRSGVIGSTLANVLPNKPDQLDKDYLFHVLASLYNFLNKSKTSGAVPHIDRNILLNLPIILPPLKEQQKIAAILSSVDDAIEKTKAIIEQTKVVKKGLMQELLTRGLPGRHKKFKKTGIGEIPEEWEVVKVGKAGRVQLGRQRAPKYQTGALTKPYIRVANVFDGYIDFTDTLNMDFNNIELEQYRLKNGDILLNEGQSRELVGRCAIYRKGPKDCCFQNTLIRFQANNGLASEFAFLYFQYCFYSGKFATISKQTTSVAHLGASRYANMEMPLPGPNEQEEISKVIGSIQEYLENMGYHLQHLLKTKDVLMQILLTGEVRVKV